MNTRQSSVSLAAGRAGFSMAEVLVSVAIIGILAAISLKVFHNVTRQSSDVVATEVMESVNMGVKKFSQCSYEIKTATDADSAADEGVVLGLLQTRDITVPGTPFVRPDWNPVASDSTEDYRLQWQGSYFGLLKPGEVGHGLKIDFEANDY